MGKTYTLTIQPSAAKALGKIERRDRQRIENAILDLADEPRPTRCTKLTGAEGWRIRVGDYRVVYAIHDTVQVVDVIHVGHRRSIYRNL